MALVPLPLTDDDRKAGYDWETSMNQVEFSRTMVLDRPARARAFFDRVVECSASLGRPSEVQLIFDRRVQKNTPGIFHTRIVNQGVEPRISIFYKNSRVKEYIKEGRAVRIETVINNPNDVGVKRRIEHLGELARLASESSLNITVCHLPPGTSMWNKIEHRLFSFITKNWRGRPLTSHQVVVDLIGSTTNRKGLKVRAKLDKRTYAPKIKVTNNDLASLPLKEHSFHGEWNYTIHVGL